MLFTLIQSNLVGMPFFKFLNMWLAHPFFPSLLTVYLIAPTPDSFSPARSLIFKLQRLKLALKQFKTQYFSDISNCVKRPSAAYDSIVINIQEDTSSLHLFYVLADKKELMDLMNYEEHLYAQ